MSNFDLLDRYFSNELDKSELKAFNDRLANDPEFNQEFQEIKEIKLAVKIEARKELKSLFTDIEGSLNQQLPTNKKTAMKNVFTVAASLILLISASYFVLIGNGQPSPKDVFTEYYQPYTNLSGQVRGEAINTNAISAEAYNAYDAGDFALAAEKFEALVEVEKTAENYFYMGIANIETGNYEAAVTNLNTTLNNFATFQDQSKWYLSMALLGANKEIEALSSLVALSTKKNSYKEKSVATLAKLGFTLDDDPVEGPVEANTNEPDGDTPDGSFIEQRQIQFGVISSMISGRKYRYHTDSPIPGLAVGDIVEFIILREAKGKKGRGFAFILDKIM